MKLFLIVITMQLYSKNMMNLSKNNVLIMCKIETGAILNLERLIRVCEKAQAWKSTLTHQNVYQEYF